MTTAADIMHRGTQWVPATETLDRAAQLMREHGVGALPVGESGAAGARMVGIITDRDIVTECVAAGHDPGRITAGDLCQGTPQWISTDADVEEVLRAMESHQIRRMPVINADKDFVGMISESDLARHLAGDQLVHFVERIYA